MRSLFLYLAILSLAVFGLGTPGCPGTPTPDDDTNPTPVAFDWDLYVELQAGNFSDSGQTMIDAAVASSDPAAFADCVVGVSYKSFGDGAQAWGVPLKQSLEAGAMNGELSAFSVDPSPCVGLPGTPDSPAAVDAAREEVERVCMYASPLTQAGLHAGSLGAMYKGDIDACVWLKTIGDAVPSICGLAVATLEVIEEPGAAWYGPAVSWDAGWCWL